MGFKVVFINKEDPQEQILFSLDTDDYANFNRAILESKIDSMYELVNKLYDGEFFHQIIEDDD